MVVSLTAISGLLRDGVKLWSIGSRRLYLEDVPSCFSHLRFAFHIVPIKVVADLLRFPNRFEIGDLLYERKMVFSGREYPQGWGRGPGGAAAETPPEPDGKVDTFKFEDNENMKALHIEISSFQKLLYKHEN